MYWAIFGLIGMMIGGIAMFVILNPKRIRIIQANHETEIKNVKAEETLKFQKAEVDKTWEEIQANNQKIKELREEYQRIHEECLESQQKITSMLNEYEANQKKIVEENIERAKENFRNQLLAIQYDATQNFISNQEEIQVQIADKTSELNELIDKVNAATEANKRAEEMKNQQDFYRLQVSNEDVSEIKILRTIEPRLRDPAPLNKVIYKVYYENAYTALVGRVFGQRKKVSGIYKITNIDNQMCYVGQSVDIAERWRQHIKRGVGADTPQKNKLYPALKSIGVENFTFEVIEECESDKLDEREKFWTDFYKAQEFGYVVKKG